MESNKLAEMNNQSMVLEVEVNFVKEQNFIELIDDIHKLADEMNIQITMSTFDKDIKADYYNNFNYSEEKFIEGRQALAFEMANYKRLKDTLIPGLMRLFGIAKTYLDKLTNQYDLDETCQNAITQIDPLLKPYQYLKAGKNEYWIMVLKYELQEWLCVDRAASENAAINKTRKLNQKDPNGTGRT